MAIHDLYGVLLDTTKLGGVQSRNVNLGAETRGEPADGDLNPTFLSTTGQKPSASFSTLAISTALAKLDATDGTYWTITGAGATLYARKHVTGGTRAGVSSHRSYAIAQGIVIPRTLSIAHQGDAVLSVDIMIIHDGSANNPVVITDSVTLATGFTGTERFTLGSTTIEGVALTSIRSMEIDFGVQASMEGADSSIFDILASIQSISPTITLTGIDMEWLDNSGLGLSSIPFGGKATTHASTTIFLRRRLQGGTYSVSNDHISITAAGLTHITDAIDGSSNTANETSLILSTFNDGSNNPLGFDFAATLP